MNMNWITVAFLLVMLLATFVLWRDGDAPNGRG